jgi:histone-lysine N-methyltransferase SETD3
MPRDKVGVRSFIRSIPDNANNSSEPQNKNQQLALVYRHGQLHVLKAALASVSEYIQQSISFNFLCVHGHVGPGMNGIANFLSLECAFGWLQRHYQREYTAVINLIADDQEEPLPLNWAAVVEDWDNTYWIIWIFILWILQSREGSDLMKNHQGLAGWISRRFLSVKLSGYLE